MALGLISSENLDDFWSQNTRRKIFYSYPNGTAPLTGLLSMMENQDTPQPAFGWNEERWTEIRTQTIAGPTANNTFYTAGTTTSLGSPFTAAALTSIRIYVNDASIFQIDDTVKFFNLSTSGISTDVMVRVSQTNTTGLDYIEGMLVNAATAVLNTAANVGKYAIYHGSAFAEGSRSRTGRQKFPSEITNYTQIHKTAFELTRTALKEPLKYDKTGAYKDTAKTNGIDHLSGLERTAFFGERQKTTATDPDTGATVRLSFSGGLYWFMKQWELGSVAAGGAFDYGQEDVSAQTDYVTYTNKRIIKLGGSTVTKSTFNLLMSRVFERTNSSDWCKLCLCGPDYLAKIADYFERQIQYTSLRNEGFDGFNFELIKHTSNAGTIYYKQHPLFTSPEMRNSAFYIDLGYMGYRPLTDSDTDIQPMIQPPDADKRKDQWLTECGFEVRFPEANLYVENLGGITA